MRALLAAALALAGWLLIAKERRSEAERQQEKLHGLRKQLARRSASPSLSEEQQFLHGRAAALLDRLKPPVQDRYAFDRITSAVENLLEASEEISESRERESRSEPDEHEKATRDLQRYYFRLQQAEYFAALCGENDAAMYVKHSRALYQQGRSAYDARQYPRARKLAEAAALVVGALERLAQARLSGPEPPRLK